MVKKSVPEPLIECLLRTCTNHIASGTLWRSAHIKVMQRDERRDRHTEEASWLVEERIMLWCAHVYVF